jgi:hydrogenase maturation protease
MAPKRILVAGIGNIFFGDDAFGCEVAAALMRRSLPEEVRVVDFGIRSYDLAYAIMDGPDVTILVDATSQGKSPGTIFLIEPDQSLVDNETDEVLNAHSMNPLRVLQMVRSMGGKPGRLYLVGCEPAVLEPEEGAMGLSEMVQAAVPKALEMIESLVQDLLSEKSETERPVRAADAIVPGT